MSEHDEQVTFFDWVRINRECASNLKVRDAMKLCYAVPNGASMSDSQRIRMVREGMTKDILDINLDWPVLKWDQPGNPNDLESFFGLRIENKFGKNTLTKGQKEKKALLEAAGFKVVVCCSAVQDVRAVFEYLPFKVEDYQGIREFL